MQFSIGIYALILITLFILVPGFITRRFYYNGQFSKQIFWANKNINALFYSLLTGALIILLYIALLNTFLSNAISIDESLITFHKIFISNKEVDESLLIKIFNGFSKTTRTAYLPFLFGLYLFSALFGFFFCKLILHLGLDVKFKLFRFANAWHYLFNGKILKLDNPFKSNTKKKTSFKACLFRCASQ